MPHVSQEAMDELEALHEAEKQSLADDLAEAKLEIEALKIVIQRLMSDRSLAV